MSTVNEIAAISRIKELITLQTQLSSAFPENEYNVFVFGSYPTVRFSQGESDVDIAVFCDSISLYKKISFEIERFFEEKNIPVDLFYIDLNLPEPFYVAPLTAQIQFTDYYPDKLKSFAGKCSDMLYQVKRSMAV